MGNHHAEVDLTTSFLERLDDVFAFHIEAGKSSEYGDLLRELQTTVLPLLMRFPRAGKRYLDQAPSLLPHSAEAMTHLGALPPEAVASLHMYRFGDHLILYALTPDVTKLHLLCIWHHRQLSFDFARLWPGANSSA